MTPAMTVIGVVLAGGKSSRMGQDKAALRYCGTTLLDTALALLQQVGVNEQVVSGRPEHPQGIADVVPHNGPPGAVFSVLTWLAQQQRLQNQALLLIPLDMPLLSAATLRTLLAACQPNRAAYFAGQVFPCLLPASAALLQHVQGLFASEQALGGQKSLRALLKHCDAVEIAVNGIAVQEFANVNTPAEWQAIQ